MIRVLILDDEKHRVASYHERFAEHAFDNNVTFNVQHVETASACIRALQRDGRFDLILLDHDLGGKQFVDSSDPKEDCGMRVAEFLRDNPEVRSQHGAIVVHSFNPDAGRAMARMLKCLYIPGFWTEDQFHLELDR